MPDDEAMADVEAMAGDEIVPDNSEVGERPESIDANSDESERVSGERVSSPRKVMRISTMLKQLLEETHQVLLDEVSRSKLVEIYIASLTALTSSVSPDLQDELKDLRLSFYDEGATDAEITDIEVRIALAQLVGWLEGLMQGIKNALTAATSGKEKETEKSKPDPNDRPGQYL